MIHLYYFITRREDMEAAAFHDYWERVHGPIVAKIDQLERYLQSHEISHDAVTARCDGAAEAWLRDLETLTATMDSDAYLNGALADEPNFIDMNCVTSLILSARSILNQNNDVLFF